MQNLSHVVVGRSEVVDELVLDGSKDVVVVVLEG